MAFEWLNDKSRKFLAAGYLSEGEQPEERILAVAQAAEKILGIDGFAAKFYDYMGKGWISLSSPIWANFGKERGLPISCFNSHIPDNTSGILHAQSEVGIMSKMGGGTSGYFGDVRPRGSKVKDSGVTSGSVHFMELFQTATNVISQGGVRRGYMASTLPIDHGDIDEFLDIGTEGHPIQTMNTGVTVTDKWLEEMKAGDSEKRRVWAKVLKRRSEIGYPYILFHDTVNRNKPEVYKDLGMEIKSSNLCVAPETLILTDTGYIEIAELAGQKVNVWNGSEWSSVDVVKTGSNQKLVKVNLNNETEIECTPYHKFYVKNSYHKGPEEKRAWELKPGDKILKPASLPVISGYKELENAYANGFYSGDGCLTKQGKRIYFYHQKRSDAIKNRVGDIFKSYYVQENQNREYGNSDVLRDKFFVPIAEYSVESRLEWLAGILDSDGTVSKNGKTQSLQICTINKEFAKDIYMMLQTLGVNSRINKSMGAGWRMMPANDGTGQMKEFECQEAWRVLIGQGGVTQLLELGLKLSRLEIDADHTANRECSHFAKVVNVTDEGRIDDTYCFNEPKRHKGMFNGILTGQCQEVLLPSSIDESFVCDLSSVNMLHYDEWKDTDLIETMVFFLDAVMEEFINKIEALRDSNSRQDNLTFLFMERPYNFAKRHRALGLGVLGWASYLQSKMIPFASEKASAITAQAFENIQNRSYEASRKLAEMFGEPEVMKGYGRRNSTLNALAPTTSSAFILGQVSQSIEPLMSNYYIKDLAKIKAEVKNPFLEKLLEEKGMNTREVWDKISKDDGSVMKLDGLTDEEKAVFMTFDEIDPKGIIEQAAIRQQYLDQGQSLNLKIPTSYSPKEINEVTLYAWEMGITTLYYQHSSNAAQQFIRGACGSACEA